MATVSPQQRSRIRIHAGVPDSDVYTDAVFGPRLATADVDRFVSDLNETALPYLLSIVERMDRIQELQAEAGEDAAVSRLGQMQLNEKAFDSLESQYMTWRGKLLEALNPAYARSAGAAGSVNGVWR